MMPVPVHVLTSITTVSVPSPWQRRGPFAVGGLWAVGFGPGSDLLLVLSVNGSGVFDCLSGGRVARDPDDDTYDESSETAAGLGPLAGSRVAVYGTGGGIVTRRILPLESADGWVAASALVAGGANEGIFLRAPVRSGEPEWAKIAETEEVRAIGFSPTGRALVVAEPHTLHVWCR